MGDRIEVMDVETGDVFWVEKICGVLGETVYALAEGRNKDKEKENAGVSSSSENYKSADITNVFSDWI